MDSRDIAEEVINHPEVKTAKNAWKQAVDYLKMLREHKQQADQVLRIIGVPTGLENTYPGLKEAVKREQETWDAYHNLVLKLTAEVLNDEVR